MIGNQRRATLAAIELGAILCRLGEKETALTLYYSRLPLELFYSSLPADDQTLRAHIAAEAGRLEADLGRPDLAAEQFQIAETLYRELGDIHQQAHCLDTLSKVCLQQGDLLRSRRFSRRAKELWPTLGSCCRV
jgi:tetratricopeptide (TPR) repeat protein